MTVRNRRETARVRLLLDDSGMIRTRTRLATATIRLVSALVPASLPLALLPSLWGCGSARVDQGSDADAGLLGNGGGTGSGGGGGGTATVVSPITPQLFTGDGGSCLGLGAACASGADCCSGGCASGACSYPACASDHAACAKDGDCCSQHCAGGVCQPLNSACKTLGNACATGGECCSHLCVGGSCQAPSFCGQPGDACSAGADCCTGTCNKATGQALGTCAASAPHGPANCGLVDGQLCDGSGPNSNAVRADGGLPLCGGPCCSRACAPWGPTGVLVCQPATGCHVVGDLCTQDTDCCGSAGLPGGSHKPVTCVINPGETVGVCRNPMGCKPDGDVCKLKTMSCNASCDCCSGNCETEDTCKQDNLGVPRCAAAACVNAGGACASSANCCGGAPCVPNPVAGGSPAFVCSGSQCVAACGGCTTTADCCPGTSCVLAPGSTHGTCGPCGGSGTGDGGASPPDAGPGDGGGNGGNDGGGNPGSDGGGNPGSDGGDHAGNDGGVDAGPAGPGGGGNGGGGGPTPTCAQFGQICQTTADCCNAVPCTQGRCQVPVF